jgi:glycosyltransferase involved in cell wall biosynthesis
MKNPAPNTFRKRVVVDATASLSGGRAYVGELLPRLVETLPYAKWVIYGDEISELEPLSADRRVEFRTVAFPDGSKSLMKAGLAKLFWREIVLPLSLAFVRPAAFFSTANFASPLFSLFRVPVVLVVQNVRPFHDPRWYRETSLIHRLRRYWLRRLTLRSVSRSKRTIVPSAYAKQLLCALGINRDTLNVVHHGVRRTEQQWRGECSDTVLVVSHYHAYKNIDIPIRALARIKDETGLRIKLLVQGIPYEADYYARLAELVRALSIADSVHLGKGVDSAELFRLYASSRCLIFPAIGENCPMTLLEAMSVGTPIIAASCEPLPEICGPAAIYYDTFDERSCAAAIVRLIRESNTAKDLSAAGRRRAADFSVEQCAEKTSATLAAAWET